MMEEPLHDSRLRGGIPPMKKVASFLVDRRTAILLVFLVLALISLFLMGQVRINYDMSVYLPPESGMKQGIELMNQEFGEAFSSDLRVMFSGLSENEREEIAAWLSGLEHVSEVAWEEGDMYNRDGFTLFEITTNLDSHSPEAESIYKAVHEKYDSMGVMTSGSIHEANVPVLPLSIVVLAVSMLMAILFLMCNSWFEPVIFLMNIGIAVAINLGTNIVLGSISEYTASIVAIMQLVLSMDYSIILLNRYTQEKTRAKDNPSAMKAAIVAAFPAITGSSLTTFAGLLSLVFMSFRIGADMGISLAKSVIVSLICILTVLPALILMSDKWIVRTRKKALHIPMKGYSGVVFRGRILFVLVFVLVFTGVFLLRGNTEILYMLQSHNKVDTVFDRSNTLVLLYESKDHDRIGQVLSGIEEDEKIRNVTGLYNTLGKAYRADEITALLGDDSGLDPAMIRLVYTDCFGDSASLKVTMKDLITFILDQADSGQFPLTPDEQTLSQLHLLRTLSDPDAISTPMSPGELASLMGVDEGMISTLFSLTGTSEQSLTDFSRQVMNLTLVNPLVALFLDRETAGNLVNLQNILNMAGKEFTQEEFSEFFGGMSDLMSPDTVSLLYLYYASRNAYDPSWAMTPPQLIDYVATHLLEDPRFSAYITEDVRQTISQAGVLLKEGAERLEGEHFGRILITSVYPEDAAETRAFLRDLSGKCESILEGRYYLIGASAMNEEMSRTFNDENNRMTLITAALIYVVVALTFRSFLLPLILVLIVQCGVYLTMTFIGLSGGGIYYMALLMVQCILMGATIDYGILYSTYYQEYRRSLDRREAVEKAYDGSMHTILTSAMIMILVTGVLGFVFGNPAIGEICLTISRGAASATVLVIFVLPGILVAFDRFTGGKKRTSPSQEKSAE